MSKIYITGDRHGKFNDLVYFTQKFETTKDDILILLGDVGLNYYVKKNDDSKNKIYKNSKRMLKLKRELEALNITLFCIHGNHEARPETINSYKEKEWNGANVYYEEEFPSILFAQDGEIYNISGNRMLVLGGAYSVDKYYRLARYQNGDESAKWFSDEQMSYTKMKDIKKNLADNIEVDYVLSHTCPLKYEPREAFLGLNQDMIDKKTEKFLDEMEDKLTYKQWYCGHYHINKKIDKLSFLYDYFDEIVENTSN